MLSFSLPLGRLYGTEECKVTMTSHRVTGRNRGSGGSGSYSGGMSGGVSGMSGMRGGNSNSSSSSRIENGRGTGTGSGNDSGSGSSSGRDSNRGSVRSNGSESVVQLAMTVRDVIASPETSGCPVDNDDEPSHATDNNPNSNSISNSHSHSHSHTDNMGSGTTKNTNHSSSSSSSSSTPRQRCRWHTTYHGTTFGLRHSLTVTLKRPWYAWSPEVTVPLSLYRLSQPMVGGVDGTAPPRICGRHEDAEDEEENNVLPLRVRVGGWGAGVCGLTVPSRWVDLDVPLLGKVSGMGGVGWGGVGWVRWVR